MMRRARSTATSFQLNAHGQDQGGGPAGFEKGDDPTLVPVAIERIQSDQHGGSVVFLAPRYGRGTVLLPIYIGESERVALESEMQKSRPARPLTHDLFKRFIDSAHFAVSRVVITDLKHKVYHARLFVTRPAAASPSPGGGAEGGPTDPRHVEFELDARPSDAINLAVRCGAPVYIDRHVLEKAKPFLIGKADAEAKALRSESNEQIEASIRALLLTYRDPTMEMQARMAVAVAENRFQDAARLRDAICNTLAEDRMAAICVAMESALNDKRFEEAAMLRNTFLKIGGSSSTA